MENGSALLLFDLDETLTYSYQVISEEMKASLLMCKDKGYHIAVVSGSDYKKVEFQLKSEFLENFNFVFCENGTQVYKKGRLVHSESIVDSIPNELLTDLFNYILRYISDLDIPKKRGTFVELRKSVINISPIGRNCSEDERKEFYDLDCKLKIREKMRNDLTNKFKDREPKLSFSLGGKISVDCFPVDWNKSFCLQFLNSYKSIHFFGDMTYPGGNDYELYENPGIIGHSVKNYHDTIDQLNQMFLWQQK